MGEGQDGGMYGAKDQAGGISYRQGWLKGL